MNSEVIYLEYQKPALTEEETRTICQRCGGLCCKISTFGKMLAESYPLLRSVVNDSPMVREYELAPIEENSHLKVSEFLKPGPISTLKQKENGDCIFLGEDGCTIHSVCPHDCRLWPEIVIGFDLPVAVVRIPLDVEACLLSQVLIGSMVLSKDGNLQNNPEAKERYWASIFDMPPLRGRSDTEASRQAATIQLVFRYCKPRLINTSRHIAYIPS
ncbi:MAG: YkgJ family cysteine cluster protein [bacterium]|nr:YkgJ family cysteine cluster protein [bacterium]